MRSIACRALSACGYRVDSAASLAEARAMDPGRYDALVVDARLGSERGIDLVEALRSADPAAAGRCLVMTGGSADEIPDGIAYLAKPFEQGELIDAVRGLRQPRNVPAPGRRPGIPPDSAPQPAAPVRPLTQLDIGEPHGRQLLGLTRELRARERHELVDFLHDGPIQELTALTLELEMMARSASSGPAGRFAAILQRLSAAAASLRWLIDGNWPFLAPETRLASALQQRTAWLLAGPATVQADGQAAALGAVGVPVIVDVVELMLLGIVAPGPPARAHVAVRTQEHLIQIELTLTPAADGNEAVGDPVAAKAALDGLASALRASAHVEASGQQLRARMVLRRQPAPGLPSLAELDEARAQSRQAQRLENIGLLAGGIAHDFNNHLAVILNYASFISEGLGAASEPDWAQRREGAIADLKQVTLAAERAASLTRQLLAFSRREVTRPRAIDIGKIVTGIEEMLRRTIGEHVELVISLADELWPTMADPSQLEQLLVNLAINARDAMPRGGILTIDTSNVTVDADSIAGGSTSRQGRNVRLRVSDTGTGMSPEVVEHAFEPFFTTKEEGEGTGLGLASVYGIVAQADGQISIYSEVGVGTTFSITLPVTTQSPIPYREPVSYQRRPKGEAVLVVEDAEALREVTKRIFARAGYDVITAANGPEAIKIAGAYPGEIHLLVTDVVMPYMLGKEVAEKMRQVKPGIAVLYMSGYARPVLASAGRLDPSVALVEKPFSAADLLAKAGEVLNGQFPGFGNSATPA
jgi:signal transduction histidine kinase/DNA-binding response OmpR family regulator